MKEAPTGPPGAAAAGARAITPRAAVRVACDTISAAAIAAWVGGHVALGAYAARIAFRDLPRDLASTTMTTVFGSFDTLARVALALLLLCVVSRVVALGRAALRGADFVLLAAACALLAVGAAGIFYAHPAIERMFHEGNTLSPAFAAMHKLSEKLGHLEALSAVIFFGALAAPRRA